MNTARLNQGTPLLLNAVSKHYAENIVLNQPFSLSTAALRLLARR